MDLLPPELEREPASIQDRGDDGVLAPRPTWIGATWRGTKLGWRWASFFVVPITICLATVGLVPMPRS